MGAERGLRQRIRAAIRYENPDALIVGQPANGMTGPGRHDLYVVVVGRFVGLEVKTSTGRATQIQLDRIKDTRRAGGYAWLVRSTRAACWAVRLARTGVFVAEESDFDIDSLLASFRKGDAPEEPVLSGGDPEDLNREIAGFVPQCGQADRDGDPCRRPPGHGGPHAGTPGRRMSEEHIAAAAQANGTAAGDGEALGEAQTPMNALTQAITGLTAAVRDLRITAEQLKTARDAQAAPKGVEPPDDLMAMLGVSPEEESPEEAEEPEPSAPASPPARKRRKPAP